MSVSRGAVWWAAIPTLGDRPVVVVSAQALNRALGEVTVARVTAVDRERSIPSFVALEAGEVLPARSFVICHNLFTLPTSELRKQIGTLTADRMLEVEDALRQALDL
ncbi:MAG TPA: type II toxin-antitoxin system PemK/MazF family toxin [Solirubrobacteraceae bacterium]|nr:type II toxin-antitoxin system PemK/MazF family toxin [Solirubrobacteraceae bacterium]